MRIITGVALGTIAGLAVTWAVLHRRVIMAAINGEPLPEPPEWHKAWHPCTK